MLERIKELGLNSAMEENLQYLFGGHWYGFMVATGPAPPINGSRARGSGGAPSRITVPEIMERLCVGEAVKRKMYNISGQDRAIDGQPESPSGAQIRVFVGREKPGI